MLRMSSLVKDTIKIDIKIVLLCKGQRGINVVTISLSILKELKIIDYN